MHESEIEEAIAQLAEQQEKIEELMMEEADKVKKLKKKNKDLIESASGLRGEIEQLSKRNQQLEYSVELENKSQLEILDEFIKIKIELNEKGEQGRHRDIEYAALIAENERLTERKQGLTNSTDLEKKSKVEILEELTKIKIEMKEKEEEGLHREEEYACFIAENGGSIAKIEKLKEVLASRDEMISELEEQLQTEVFKHRTLDLIVEEGDCTNKFTETKQPKNEIEVELLRADRKIEKLKSAIEKCESDYGQQKKEIKILNTLQTKLLKEKEQILTAHKQLIIANRELLTINANMQEQVFKYENTAESMAQDLLKIGQAYQEKEKANKILITKIEGLQSNFNFVMNQMSKI